MGKTPGNEFAVSRRFWFDIYCLSLPSRKSQLALRNWHRFPYNLAFVPFVAQIGVYSLVQTFWGQWHCVISSNGSNSITKTVTEIKKKYLDGKITYCHCICNCVAATNIHCQIRNILCLVFHKLVCIYQNSQSYNHLDHLFHHTDWFLRSRNILKNKK